MCEKINKNERKNKAELITEMMGSESKEFWLILGESEGLPPEAGVKVFFNIIIHDSCKHVCFRNTSRVISFQLRLGFIKYSWAWVI